MYLVTNNIINLSYNITLSPEEYGDPDIQHNLKKLIKMYTDMGFKFLNDDNEVMTISLPKMFEWCKNKYPKLNIPKIEEPPKKKEAPAKKKKIIKKEPVKKDPSKKAPKKKKTDEEESDELDKAIKKYRDKVENHKDILDIDYKTSIKTEFGSFVNYNAYYRLLNDTSVSGTIPERIEKYKKKLDYADEVIEKNKIKVEKFREDLRKVTNDYYGELVKIEKKVLNGSLKDDT
jgi:hypothetical protein